MFGSCLQTPNGQAKMNNQEKVATLGTQDTRRRQTKQKHSTICVGHPYAQANTNNVNKT
jgi:fido (protein-threonine AMPylation protein)